MQFRGKKTLMTLAVGFVFAISVWAYLTWSDKHREAELNTEAFRIAITALADICIETRRWPSSKSQVVDKIDQLKQLYWLKSADEVIARLDISFSGTAISEIQLGAHAQSVQNVRGDLLLRHHEPIYKGNQRSWYAYFANALEELKGKEEKIKAAM